MLTALLTPVIIPALIVVAVIAAVLIIFNKSYYKAPSDEMMVVTGMGAPRYVTANSTFVIPFLQRVDYLNLGVVQCLLTTNEMIPTKDAILITAKAVANFQISSQPEEMQRAARNYLNQEKDLMMQDVSEVLLGKMREVIGEMELKDIMTNRALFNKKVFDGAKDDMSALGLELTTFNMQDFQDREEVIKNMGADQANEIRKQAQLARINADQEVAVRQNELDLKEAELKKKADQARAEADLVFQTITAERTRELRIAEQEAAIANEEKKIELAEKAVAVRERELEADIRKRAEAERYAAEQQAEVELFQSVKEAEAAERDAKAEAFKAQQESDVELYRAQKAAEAAEREADASLYKAEKDADAVKKMAAADAERIKAIGEAEGAAEKERGEGIAAATQAQVEAYNNIENANFLADRYIGVLPEVANAVAAPLASVEGITMYGEGNAASLVGETTRTMSQINSALSDTLGFDLKDVVSGMVMGSSAGREIAKAQESEAIWAEAEQTESSDAIEEPNAEEEPGHDLW